jgi:pimeloyl-ACP methyl ester carboxylesterase
MLGGRYTLRRIKRLFRYIVALIFSISFSALGQTKQIQVDDLSIEYLDFGKGKYTFVFESGVGMGVNYWDSFLPFADRLNSRVIIYSRAGNGSSSASSKVSLERSLLRLEKLLFQLNAQDNLILVGHSFGGFHARNFAHNFVDRVSGLVLLDPSHELFQKELEAIDPEKAKNDNARLNSILKNQSEWQILQDIYTNNVLFPSQPAHNVPTVIVTSSQIGESDWWIGHSEKGKIAWRALHQELISNNSISTHIVTDKVGHNLPIQDPEFTFKAIKSVLELVEGV